MSDQYVGGKGDKRRKENREKINQNWDKISEKERQEWYEFLKLSEGENNE